ncbi:MAG: hypothetical protein QGD95_06930, partial [Actinomycetota bacterium]|nr:hypothetical protein [Actinomycetota bacterium]MDK1027132.1 hypothetical protein [Actinomycetota bacterium]
GSRTLGTRVVGWEAAYHGGATNSRGSMRKYVFTFIALTFLLAACRIESNILIDISEDGSAVVAAEVGFDEDMLDLFTHGGGDPADILDELPDLGGSAPEATTRVEGDMTFFGVEIGVDDLSTYDFPGAGEAFFSDFSFEIDDSSATLTVSIGATGLGDFGGEDLLFDPSQFTGDFFSANVIVKMPGTVTEHNADEVRADGSLVWELPLSGSIDIFATSKFGESGVTWVWFVVGGVLLIGVIAVVAAVMTSRRDSEKAVAQAAAEHDSRELDAES